MKKFADKLLNVYTWVSTKCGIILLAIYCYADKIEVYVNDSGIEHYNLCPKCELRE